MGVTITVEGINVGIAILDVGPAFGTGLADRQFTPFVPCFPKQLPHGGDLFAAFTLGTAPVGLALMVGVGVRDDVAFGLSDRLLDVLGGGLGGFGGDGFDVFEGHGRHLAEGDFGITLTFAQVEGGGDFAERTQQLLQTGLDPAVIGVGVEQEVAGGGKGGEEGIHHGEGAFHGGGVDGCVQLAQQHGGGELQLADGGAVGGEGAGPEVENRAHERAEFLAGGIAGGVEQPAEDLAGRLGAFAEIPGAHAADGVDQVEIVVDDGPGGLFDGPDLANAFN